ncbi:MAG: PAC2 family protein [Chloroflexi bacterium]|nr:MAG: PAC2 family protein [Chloroflexota bacterium]
MQSLIHLWEKPTAKEIVMIAGWRQWADAGSISSTLPEYLIEQTGARKIGAIVEGGYYLFQLPGTHHLLRPVIKLEDGYRQSFEVKRNEFYYAGNDDKGLIIFLGDEPHLNVEKYADGFFQAILDLQITQVVGLGGVYGPMPYDKARDISCIYSLPEMKASLENYNIRFSNYEGGATIGSYLIDRAEREKVNFLALYAFVPAYDFAQSASVPQGIQIEQDYKAWHDLMRRINHWLGLSLNMADLEERAIKLIVTMDEQVAELEKKMPQLNVREYLESLTRDFTERPFDPLADVWEEEFRDLFKDLDE